MLFVVVVVVVVVVGVGVEVGVGGGVGVVNVAVLVVVVAVLFLRVIVSYCCCRITGCFTFWITMIRTCRIDILKKRANTFSCVYRSILL